MLKNIFQLIRFPGIFTAFSNVLIGFFLVSNGNFEFNLLPFLLTTTGLLFAGTMVMNDYADRKIDSVERIIKSKIPEIINDVIGRADLFDKPHIKRTFNKINTTNVKEIQDIVLRDIENAKNEKEKKEIKKGYNDFLRMIDEVIKSDPNVNKNLKNYSKFYNNAIYKID